MLSNGKIEQYGRTQDLDCKCFRGNSKTNKSAKRTSRRRIKRLLDKLNKEE